MQNFEIKPLEITDVDTIHTLVGSLVPLTHHTWYTYWTEIMSFGNSCFKATLKSSGEIVGFITSHPILTTPKPEWFCWQIGVVKGYRRRGVGIALMEHVVDAALSTHATALQFTIEPENTASLATVKHVAKKRGFAIETKHEVNTHSGIEILYRMKLN